MFNLDGFLNKLDGMYTCNIQDSEVFLKSGLLEARQMGDHSAVLVILNELIGYYRVMSRPEDCDACIRQAVQTADAMGIQGTVSYATMLLNIGTAQRAMGRLREAEEQYQRVFDIYNKEFTEPDYRMATLYNNRSILYVQTGRYKEAKQDLEAAMKLIQAFDQSRIEVAVTHVNTGNVCFAMQDIEEGMYHMKAAVHIFEQIEGKKDSHYASALSGLGEAYFRNRQWEDSVSCYEKALEEILSNYGENDYYRTTKKNLELVKDTRKRVEAIQIQHMNGMDISRKYYETYGKSLIERNYAEYKNRIAAGLVGEGSECMGCDDEYSVDHDFGPGFCLWLTQEDYNLIGEQLQKDYESLPKEFMGFPTRNTTKQGSGRVGVFCIDDFYRRFTGYACAPDAETKAGEEEWLAIDMPALCKVTNGEVFTDPLGEFTRRRREYMSYPKKIRIHKLAQALGLMAQAGQYNYGRMCKRNDKEAAWLCRAEFINAAISAGYLLNKNYEPFYKWKIWGMKKFTCLTSLKEELAVLMRMKIDGNSEEAVMQIENICNLFVQELNRQNLTACQESFLEVQKQKLLEGIL